jgi:5-methylcytosine-specific restriction endonuclease McrA
MGADKKLIRKSFRDACYSRDKFCCAKCGKKSSPSKAEEELDAHHITDRSLMPHGGYVKENGVSLCPDCHLKAEVYHSTGVAIEGYSPDDLYKIINSNLEKAIKASDKLKI